ncbi:YjiH family protein [Paludifilum halophilum]|uniref:Histidine transporter n=1 Tax=Paludifilum halophilum TaxID=1642702 RepID=A0A235B1Z0_9BACL|nr:YjiH family protein [Paludifilum halophilum]OYD06241.1 histidine transporter [Paludifilum halophilum]
MNQPSTDPVKTFHQPRSGKPVVKFFLFSIIGLFMFFVPVTVNDRSSIPLDHLVTFLEQTFPSAVSYYVLTVIGLGALHPFVNRTWNRSGVDTVFSILKGFGFVVAIMLVFQTGPSWLFIPDIGPFLFEKLVIPVGLLVPIGSAFLALLAGYGLLEFIGTWMRPIMRAIWKTPGRSAIDAVASFVGSYSIGLLITNRMYKEGRYTAKEAAIIATGFSTVSATFMIVVAKTLHLMEIWNLFFWVALLTTFSVTAVTVRLWPLNQKRDTYYTGEGRPEALIQKNRWQHAWREAMQTAAQSPPLARNLWSHLRDGFVMTMAILPSILSVGLIGLLLAQFTPFFDGVGFLFYPLTWLLQIPEPMLAAKAASVEIAEMFLPALLVTEAPLITQFIIGVVSVSSILFFSASIPCILSTEIPVRIGEILIIWVERTLLTLIFVTPVAFLLL